MAVLRIAVIVGSVLLPEIISLLKAITPAAQAFAAWAQAHPQYWRDWRERHPDSVARNRRAQGARNARRRAAADEAMAKEDAWTCESLLPAGTYRLEPWFGTDCKCGRVNRENLFVLSAVEAI